MIIVFFDFRFPRSVPVGVHVHLYVMIFGTCTNAHKAQRIWIYMYVDLHVNLLHVHVRLVHVQCELRIGWREGGRGEETGEDA